ncbi:MAG TPA: helicase-exonuclease AddAB subunit AddB [Clostridia bacterium]|nr:helicase-exonuclease AddAB subunit AddB [Clostridia bacterium]
MAEMLRLIIGRAGAGKTRQCLEEIARKEQEGSCLHCIYLVPEQGSFHAEKNLLKYSKKGGTMQAQVLSFRRLAWRVLQEVGGGLATPLDDTGKALLLKHILGKNKDRFKVFVRVMDRPGFLEQLVRTLSEMKIYRIKPEMLAALGQETEPEGLFGLEEKLAEFTFIYQEFEKHIAQQYLDIDDNLDLLAEKLHQAVFLRQAEVWIDGFDGFTPQEYAVIRELLLHCSTVHITLCLAKEHLQEKLPETHVFYQPWETYQHLLALAAEIRCEVAEVALLPEPKERRFRERTELAFLEESFLQAGFSLPLEGAADGIKLRAAVNRREEVEMAAAEILELCREKGLRFQDIAVLLRDFTNYEDLLVNVFRDYAIPYFLDMKKPVRHHPLPDLIQAGLEVVQGGWRYEPLFRALKTDLLPISRQETDLLENYCLAHGIKGSRWTDGKPWEYRMGAKWDEGRVSEEENETEKRLLRQVNRARAKVVEMFLPFQEALQKARTGREYSAALFAFLERLQVADRLAEWSKKAEAAGQLEEARIHLQVWQKILELLDSLVEVLGNQALSLAEFSEVITGGLETLELGLIPPGLDQVLVGSVDRSRHPDIKAVLILGVNDGVFPARLAETSLFSDEEKEYFQQRQLRLAPTTEKKLYAEQFLVYRALTTASHYLSLSYAMADAEGKALAPSSLLARLVELFPRAVCAFTPEEKKAEEKISCPRPTLSNLAVALREALAGRVIEPVWWQVYNWYVGKKEWQEPLQRITSGLFYRLEELRLPAGLVRQLYVPQGILRGSVSRFERFVACPFAHYLRYGLKLQERVEFQVGAPDLGQFFHAGLELFYQYVQERRLNWGAMSKAEMQALVDEIVEQLIPRLQHEILLSTARYRYLAKKLKRILWRAVVVLGEHQRRGSFRPVGMEIAFGEKGPLPGLSFKLADGTTFLLQGRIDRVDVAQDERGAYVRVIDYKSGSTSLGLSEVYYGIKLQLLTYLDVVLKAAPSLLREAPPPAGTTPDGSVMPAGVLYFHVKDPIIAAKGPLPLEEIEKMILAELKMKGFLLADAGVVKLMDQEIQGYSELLPVALTKSGEFYRNLQNVLPLEKFNLLCRQVEKHFLRVGEEIMAGQVSIHPYRYRGRTPCSYCPYATVCRFDLTIPGCAYRQLSEKEPAVMWEEMGLREEGGRQD